MNGDLQEIIKKWTDSYSGNDALIVSSYKGEQGMAKDYNGRQILELLQNADDAKADKVKIKIEKNKHTISILNSGSLPFSAAGVESLMVTNYSPKSKRHNIGNKGLGFRSVINWCDSLEIHSGDKNLKFSKDGALAFLKKIGRNEKKIEELNKLNDLPKGTVCFPILGMPQDCDPITLEEDYVTDIILSYNPEIEEQIMAQLSSEYLSRNVLLFLKHVRKIEIDGDVKRTLENITVEKYSEIIYQEHNGDLTTEILLEDIQIAEDGISETWHVLKKQQYYPEIYEKDIIEKEYSIMVSWKDRDSEKQYPLYCYFPTKIRIPFSFIINASFELNSSRNDLIENSKINDFLFSNLPELFEHAIAKIKSYDKDVATWNAYRFMKNHGEVPGYLSKIISDVKANASLYPSVSNQYLMDDEYKYYSEDWSSFAENDYSEIFENMLKSGNEYSDCENRFYSSEELINIIEEFNSKNPSIEQRTEFIRILYSANSIHKMWESNRITLPLLIDDESNVISSSEKAYVAVEDSNRDIEKNKPDFVSFKQVDKKLFVSLQNALNVKEFRETNSTDKSESLVRTLVRMLSPFVNCAELDISQIIPSVIRKTEDELKNNPSHKNEIVNSQLKYILTLRADDDKWFNEKCNSDNVPFLLDKNHNYKKATDLYFSESYGKIGIEVADCFKDVCQDSDYLLPLEQWGDIFSESYSEYSLEKVCNIFLAFGVNSFISIKEFSIENNSLKAADDNLKKQFANFVIDDKYKATEKDSKIRVITNFDKVSKISKLAYLCTMIDENDELKNILLNENFEICKRGTKNTEESFICWQLKQIPVFNDAFIPEKGFSKTVFEYINRNNPILPKQFKNYYDEIVPVLKLLGAKDTLESFSRVKLYDFLNELPKEKPDCKFEFSVFYNEIKKALNSDGASFPMNAEMYKDMKYGAFRGDEVAYVSREDVYYFNDKCLPKKIMDSLWILPIPLRQGGDQVKKIFGVKNKYEAHISFGNILYEKNREFKNVFSQLKEYILAIRFINNDINDEGKRKEAKKLNDAEIILLDNLYYTSENETNSFDDYDFISEENVIDESSDKSKDGIRTKFFVKVPKTSNLFMEPAFQDAIVEILSIIFNLRDNNTLNNYRMLISRANAPKTLIRNGIITQENCDETSQYCDLKFTQEFSFWKFVFKNYKPDFKIEEKHWDTIREMNSECLEHLGIENKRNDIFQFVKMDDLIFLQNLKEKTGIDIHQLLKENELTLWSINYNKLNSALTEFTRQFNHKLWLSCKDNYEKQLHYYNGVEFYRHIIEDYLLQEENFDSVNYDIDFNADEYLVNFVNRTISKVSQQNIINFDINDVSLSLEEKNTEFPEHEYVYSNNSELMGILNNDNRSLFYFENNEQKILDSVKKSNFDDSVEEDPSFPAEGDSSPKTPKSNRFTTSAPSTQKSSSGRGNSHRDGSHDPNRDKHNAEIGKKAEDIVEKYLKKEYDGRYIRRSNANSASGDDSFHYDFEYWNENEIHRHLEVKVENKSFFMSDGEVNHGMDENNKYYYDLAFVNVDTEEVKIVENFFVLPPNETLLNNSKFRAIPKKYEISISLQEI